MSIVTAHAMAIVRIDGPAIFLGILTTWTILTDYHSEVGHSLKAACMGEAGIIDRGSRTKGQ
jgi:hypothetical protein